MHPSLLRAFQRHQKYDLKHPSLVDLITIKTKQNKLPSWIDWNVKIHKLFFISQEKKIDPIK
jgi:hypothetical protein